MFSSILVFSFLILLANKICNGVKVFDVIEHGVFGDGMHDDTLAMQQMFDFVSTNTNCSGADRPNFCYRPSQNTTKRLYAPN